MNPVRISCKETEWKQILEKTLTERLEVDLVSLLGDYDADYCRKLGRKHSMIFEWSVGDDCAFFKKAALS